MTNLERKVGLVRFSTLSRAGLAGLFVALATFVVPTAGAAVAAAAGTSFGVTTPGSAIDTPGANYKFGSTFTLTDRAVLTDFKFYAKGGKANQSFVPVVYNVDSAGNPTTLVAQAKAVTVAANQPVGWVTALLPTTTIGAGKYHLALLAGSNNSSANLYFTPSTGATIYNANTYPNPTASWGAVSRGNGMYSFVVDYTLATSADTTPPTAPSNLSATTPSSTQVTLSWTSSTDSGGSGLAGYRIYRADKGTAQYAVMGGGCATPCSWSESNLTASTSYSYAIGAYDGAGNEGARAAVNVTTPAPAAPAKPGPTNTGVPAGTGLTVINGTLNITVDGTVIDGKDIRGFVVIAANNVTIRRSIVHGGVATGNTGVIRSTSGCGILVEDSEITADNPSAVLDDIWAGCNFTGRRLNIHGGVDGVHAGTNARIEKSWIHGMSYFSSDPNHGGGPTHNDGIQIFSGSGIVISNNNLEMIRSDNSAVQITQDFGPVTGVTMQNNWADGGACTFNISHNNGPAPMRGVSATGNRFGRNSYFGCPMLISSQTILTQSGNVYDDNGQSVPIQQHD